ncbi:MAG: acyl-CoA synthetase [Hyphomicrobiales bacterium]
MTAEAYTGARPPAAFNLTQYCLSGKPPEKTALIVAGETAQTWTYAAIEECVLRCAGGLLAHGLEPGQRLFIRMGNSFDYAIVFFAAVAIGAIPIPASSMLTAPEVAKLLADSGASFLAWEGTLDLPEMQGVTILSAADIDRCKRALPATYAATAADDPAYLVYTSGTSGRPKGVLHAHRVIWGRRPMYRGWHDIGQDDVVLHTGAFNWTYTLGVGIFDPFAAGATSVVNVGARDATRWPDLVRSHGATIMASVPGIYRQLLRTDLRLGSSLRHALTAGEALPVSILEQWRDRTGLELYEALGLSEISTFISSSPHVPVRAGSPGKPQQGRAVRILEDGQIAVHRSDPGLLLRYWSEPRLEETWFATGDLADMDADGYIWYRGRADDQMNAGGFRVSPLEVETVLLQHPDVLDAGVREWRVSETLTIIAAFIVPQPGRSPDDAAILSFVRGRLAAYKVPKQIWFVPALPRTANGKLIRKALDKP